VSITRRRLLAGGAGALVASTALPSLDAVFAAVGAAPDPRDRSDVELLRTASSVERVGLTAYRVALGSGLVETAVVRDLLRRFRSHHREHVSVLDATTEELRGQPYRQANRAMLEQIKPSINALADEASVLTLAAGFEVIAAHTYQVAVGTARDRRLGSAAMTIGAAESRHAAALLALAGQPAAPLAFQTTEHAVRPGIGI
jgi:hypothetical protein